MIWVLDPNPHPRREFWNGVPMRPMSRGEVRAEKRMLALRLTTKTERALGLALGYPRCCVELYVASGGCSSGRGPGEVPIPPEWVGSGYVLCDACAQRDPRELWRDIMTRRHTNGVRHIRLRFPKVAS